MAILDVTALTLCSRARSAIGFIVGLLAVAACSGAPAATCVTNSAGAGVADLCAGGGAAAASGGTSTTGGNSTEGSSDTRASTGGSSTVSGGSAAFGGAASGGLPGTGGSAAVCVTDIKAAPLAGVNLFILLDRSGSMGDDSNGAWSNAATRWDPVVQTLDAFVSDSGSNRLNAALILLPASGNETAMCSAVNYTSGGSAVSIPLTLLDPVGRQLFLSRLCDSSSPKVTSCIVPAGGTPTRPALQGVINYAAQASQSNPNSKSVIVFLTDGEPGFGYYANSQLKHLYSCDDLTNGCTSDAASCIDPDEEVTSVASVIASAPAKSIFLASVGDISGSTTNIWAAASGNPAINLVSLTPTQAAATLRSALDAIRSTAISCSFQIPMPGTGTTDVAKLNVTYVDGNGNPQDMRRTADGTTATCSANAYGWYFDNPTAPNAIRLCPSTCNKVQTDASAKLDIEFGCTTLVH